jgi:TonB family protein
MSSANALSTPAQSRRRYHPRRRIDGLIYVDFGPDNGAILIDLGEGGLGFQSVVPVIIDQAILLKFKVPGETNPVEGYAEVAWLNESQKGGGLRFVELGENSRAQIRGFAGELLPEPGALHSVDAAQPDAGPETATGDSSANVVHASPAPEAATTDHAPAQAFQSFTGAENTQPPSPHAAPLAQNEAAQNEAAHSEVLASPGAAAEALLTEFIVEIDAGADAADPLVTPLVTFDAPLPETPIAAAQLVDGPAWESALPPEEQDTPEAQNSDEIAASDVSAGAPSGIPKATANLEPTVVFRPNSEIAPPPHSAAASSELSAKPAGIPRMPQHTPPLAPEVPRHLAAPPAKPSRPPSLDARNLPQPPKRQRKPAPSKPESPAPSKPQPSAVSNFESSLSPAYRQDSMPRGSFARQSAKPALAGAEWDNTLDGPEDDLKPQATLASQAFKLGIGAAAGTALVLALVFAVPSLRTAVQTTANARSAGSNLPNAPAFQVEVADLNNRRWILKGGGDAGSPFGDTPSRRDAQSAASNSARKDAAKSSRSDESDDSAETVAATQPKLPKTAGLALSRPLAKPADAPAAQLLAPSIFDGITPPVGSLTDRLPTSGPDMPSVVQPASPAGGRPSALQSAVLLQRVAPVYPPSALLAKVQGEVSVNATIGKDGVPKDLKLIKGDERLVLAAFTAIRQWRYRPATLGGEPIETQTVVTVAFELK